MGPKRYLAGDTGSPKHRKVKLGQLCLPRSRVRSSSIQRRDPRACLRLAAKHSSSESFGSRKPSSQRDKRVLRGSPNGLAH